MAPSWHSSPQISRYPQGPCGYVTLNQRPPFLFAETPVPASSPTTTVMETASSTEWSATVK